jgi:hypothetical protein
MNNTPTIIDDKMLAEKLAARDAEHLATAHDPHQGEGSSDPRYHHAAAEHLYHDGHRPEILPKNHGQTSLRRDTALYAAHVKKMRKDIHKMRDAGKARGNAKGISETK